MPPIKQTMHMVEAQPATVRPRMLAMTAHSTPTKLSTEKISPSPVMNRMGFTLRLVMPSKASASIFFKG